MHLWLIHQQKPQGICQEWRLLERQHRHRTDGAAHGLGCTEQCRRAGKLVLVGASAWGSLGWQHAGCTSQPCKTTEQLRLGAIGGTVVAGAAPALPEVTVQIPPCMIETINVEKKRSS